MRIASSELWLLRGPGRFADWRWGGVRVNRQLHELRQSSGAVFDLTSQNRFRDCHSTAINPFRGHELLELLFRDPRSLVRRQHVADINEDRPVGLAPVVPV